MFIISIFNNISLIISLSLAWGLVLRYFRKNSIAVQFFNGLLFGGFALLVIRNALVIQPGLIFDGRSIVLSVAGLFGGPITAIVALIPALIYRISIGGPGVLMGSLVIVEAALAGIYFNYRIKKRNGGKLRWNYILMGFTVHIIMLFMIFLLSPTLQMEMFYTLAIPLLVLYPGISYLVCMLFQLQAKYVNLINDLSESEVRFRQLFNEGNLVFLVVDPDSGNIVNANKAAEKFYGYTLGQLQSMKISQINTMNTKEIGLRISLAFEGIQNRFLMQHRLANGTIRDVEIFAGPVEYNGRTHLYSIVSDITERLRIESKLRESEESYRGLFNAVKDAIYIQNREGVFVDVNQGACTMYGYKREEFIGNTPEFLAAEGLNNLDELKMNIELAFNGVEIGFEFWGKRKNGDLVPKYVRLYKGQYFGEDVVIAIGHDITHRKAAQKQLEDSRFNLNALINVSDDVMILLDVSGNIITHNQSFVKFYPDQKDYIGQNIFKVIPPKVAEERRKYFRNVVETGKPISFEDFTFERDWWITYYPILDESAHTDRIAVYARDITLQRKMLNMQKNLQVAEKSALVKQQFLSNMSHEMRTPMNGIVGMSELLAQTPLSDVQADFVETIRESSNTLLAMINDVLDLAKFESGKLTLKITRVNLKDLEGKINSLFKNQASSRNLEFSIRFADNLPSFIVTDHKRLTQIITNLVGNALKFTTKGSICVKASMISDKKRQNLIRFEVEDTGIGIDKEYLDAIFDEFAQIDNSKTRKYEGTGLGLAISKRIAELLGGTIGVDSVKGKGSRFWFTIKNQESMEGVEVKPAARGNEFEHLGLRVLMVEDKVINRKVGSLLLKNMGCTCETAENGLEGIEKILKYPYDVVLMDIQMPVMDGATAVKTLRRKESKLPWIIGLSAEAMDGDAEKYMAIGMDDYMTKPIIPHVLYDKLYGVKLMLTGG